LRREIWASRANRREFASDGKIARLARFLIKPRRRRFPEPKHTTPPAIG
jgi:hypothetical protein